MEYLPALRNSALGRATSFNRMFMSVHFAGAILAAMGFDQLLARRPRPLAPLLSILLLTALAWAYTLIFNPEQLQFLTALFHLHARPGHEPWGIIWLDSSFRTFGSLLLAALACAIMAMLRLAPLPPGEGGRYSGRVRAWPTSDSGTNNPQLGRGWPVLRPGEGVANQRLRN